MLLGKVNIKLPYASILSALPELAVGSTGFSFPWSLLKYFACLELC